MAEPARTAGRIEEPKLKVFLSYSRLDFDFAEDLLEALKTCGFEPYLDKHDIAPGEPWEDRLERLIQAADSIVFVISPDSVASPRCAWEVEKAEKLGKRVLPVVWRAVTEAQTPERLRRLNYIFFEGAGRTFAKGLSDLARGLNTDIAWIREHSRLGEMATRWEARDRSPSMMLRGVDITNAKTWLGRRPKEAPEATELQRQFIAESEHHAIVEADLDRRKEERTGRLKKVIAAVSFATILTTGLAGAAFYQSRVANEQRGLAQSETARAIALQLLANSEKDKAVDARNKGLRSQSRYLAAVAQKSARDGDAATGLLLGLEGLPDETSKDSANVDRPFMPVARDAVVHGFYQMRETAIYPLSVDGNSEIVQGQRRIAAIRGKENLILQDIPSGTILRDIKRIERFFTTDAELRVAAVSLPDSNTQRLLDIEKGPLDLATGVLIGDLVGHTANVTNVAFSKDASRVVTGSEDKSAIVWDVRTVKPISQLAGHDQKVVWAAFSDDASLVLTSDGGSVRVWETATGRMEHQLSLHTASEQRQISKVSMSPTGRIAVLIEGRRAHIFEARTGKKRSLYEAKLNISRVVIAPDGEQMAVALEGASIDIVETRSGWRVFPLVAHAGRIIDLGFANKGQELITVGNDGTARIWDVTEDRTGAIDKSMAPTILPITRVPGNVAAGNILIAVAAVSISDDGKSVAYSVGPAVSVWDAESGAVARAWNACPGKCTVHSLAHSPDGTKLLTAGSDAKAILWDLATGQPVIEFHGHTAIIRSARFSPDGSLIVTASGDSTSQNTPQVAQSPREGPIFIDNTVRVWDAKTGQLKAILLDKNLGYPATMRSAVFSKDNRTVLSASDDKHVRFHDVLTLSEIKNISVADSSVTSAVFSPDETRIVVVAGGAAKVFSVDSEKELLNLPVYQSPVRAAIFSPDGALIATSSGQQIRPFEADASIRLWNATTGDAAGVMEGPKVSTTTLAFNADGTRLVSGSGDGKARIWSVDLARSLDASIIKRARAAAPRCLTRKQRETFFLTAEPPGWCTEQKKWPYTGAERP